MILVWFVVSKGCVGYSKSGRGEMEGGGAGGGTGGGIEEYPSSCRDTGSRHAGRGEAIHARARNPTHV